MKQRIPVTGGESLTGNPFAALDLRGLPDVPAPEKSPPPQSPPAKKNKRGKVHARIEKSGRGGKIVTVLFGEGIETLSAGERSELLRALKNALGTGGTLGDAGTLELQGDERPRATAWLQAAGFR